MSVRIGINPVAAVSGLLLSLMLAACGGGGGGPTGGVPSGGPPEMNITPPLDEPGADGVPHYGATSYGFLGQNCSGWAAGVATGHSNQDSASSAAISLCRIVGGTDCGPDATGFGSAYSRGNLCAAVAYGETDRACRLGPGRGATEAEAEADALSKCRRSGGFSCRVATSACSTSGPEDAYSRTGNFRGGTGGGGTGSGTSPCPGPLGCSAPGSGRGDGGTGTGTGTGTGNREYIPTWFTCANDRISETGYGYGSCFEYLLSTRSLRQQFEQACRNGPGRFVGDGALCYGTYGRPAFGGTSAGCQITNPSGTEIRYELYDRNSYRPTGEELIASCRARRGTLR